MPSPHYLFFVSLLMISLGVVPAPAAAQQVKIPITFHRQEHALSCEIASLKTALHTQGINFSEAELITQLVFDRTPKQDGIWGNPYQGFVGDIAGRMLVTGYGVYAEPIAKVGSRHAHTEVMHQGSVQKIARAVAAGHPVIIWGHYGQGTRYAWQTPDNHVIQAIDGEHTRVVYGFDGTTSTPTRFYLMDPLTGPFTWTTTELTNNWSSLDNMAVVVAPRWVRVPGETQIWEINASGTTRHWITNWETFLARGGSLKIIVPIEKNNLMKYKIGPDISST